MADRKPSESDASKSRAARVVAALAGLIVAGFCLLIFIFRLSGRVLMLDSDLVFFYFVACGIVAGIGLLFVYRLLRGRAPRSLVEQSGGVAIEPVDRIDACVPGAQRQQNLLLPSPGASSQRAEVPLMNTAPQKVSRYKTNEASGAIGLVVMIGMAIAFMVGSTFARQILPLAIPAGGIVALMLYWARRGNLA